MKQKNETKILKKTYEVLLGDDSVKKVDISEKAARNVRYNFVLFSFSGGLRRLSETLSSTDLVLAWLFTALGIPTFITGLLVPVERVVSEISQLFVSGQLRRFKIKKWILLASVFFQAYILLLMAFVASNANEILAGTVLLSLVAVISIGKGVDVLAFNDIIGKTIPKGERGRLLSARSTIGGILALIAGLLMQRYLSFREVATPYLILLIFSSFILISSGFLLTAVKEVKGALRKARSVSKESEEGIKLVKRRKSYRKFIITKAFLSSIPLSIPFYTIFARELTGQNTDILGSLGLFLVAVSTAKLVSSSFWGRLVDRSSRGAMILSSVFALLTVFVAIGFIFLPNELNTRTLLAIIFFLIGLSAEGAELAQDTYLLDAAPKVERAVYTAFSNTFVGLFAILGTVFGLIAQFIGFVPLFILFGIFALLGLYYSWRLPEAKNFEKGIAPHRSIVTLLKTMFIAPK